ncbi:MAG TPA: hypothetical protein VGM80_02570 [Gaiellaceae bacterium]|jgi:hypothetical protein
MRQRGTLPALAASVALFAGAALGAGTAAAAVRLDRGSDRPPAAVPSTAGSKLHLTSDGKSIWMTEWSACWHVTLNHLSKTLHIPVRAGQTPQLVAKKLATRAVFLLYETSPETFAAKDGCRNGILWRYYHPA